MADSGGAVELLGRNIPSILRMAKGMDPNVGLLRGCLDTSLQSETKDFCCGQAISKNQRIYQPLSLVFLRGTLNSTEPPFGTDTVRAAKSTLRVKFSYLMIALTIVGSIIMVVREKQAVKRLETLTSINLEKKAQWREEATQSTSAKP